jgi:hypothetical protein
MGRAVKAVMDLQKVPAPQSFDVGHATVRAPRGLEDLPGEMAVAVVVEDRHPVVIEPVRTVRRNVRLLRLGHDDPVNALIGAQGA